jgi:hypothetical protein
MGSPRQSAAIGAGMLLAISGFTLAFAAASPALAGNCGQDIGNLSKQRQAIIDQLNKLAHGSKKGLDPVASCPKLRSLALVEQKLLAYLEKNKDWCMVPDQAVSNLQAGHKRTEMIAGQACRVAEQIKKSQQAVGAGLAQRLPRGPL